MPGRLYYATLNQQMSRQLAEAMGRAFEGKRRTVSGVYLGRGMIQVDGQRYPFRNESGVDVVAGDTIAVVNVGRTASAEYAPAAGAGTSGVSGGTSTGSAQAVLADHDHAAGYGSGGNLTGYAQAEHEHAEYIPADGSGAGATDAVQAFVEGIEVNTIQGADGQQYLQFKNSTGTVVATIDLVNAWLSLGEWPPGQKLHFGDGHFLLENGDVIFKQHTQWLGDWGHDHYNGPFQDPIFTWGRIVEGGDGAPNMRCIVTDNNHPDEHWCFGFDTEGIVASVRRGTDLGSHFEGFQSGNEFPTFRLNAYPTMRLEMGPSDDSGPPDVAVARLGAGLIGWLTDGVPRLWAGADGELYIEEASAAPTASPMTGVVMFVDPADGELKYRGPSGLVDLSQAGAGGGGGGTPAYTFWDPAAPPASPDTDDDEFADGTLTGWTEWDQGNHTDVSEGNGFLTLKQTSTGVAWGGVFKTAPAHTDWTATTRLRLTARKVNYNSVGLAVFQAATTDPSGSDFYWIGYSLDSGDRPIKAQRWNGYNSYGQAYFEDGDFMGESGIWVRFRYESAGSTLYFESSEDGIGWNRLYSLTPAWAIAEIGLVMLNENTGADAYARFDFFRVTNSADNGQITAGRMVESGPAAT